MDFGSLEECLNIKVHDESKYSDGKELFRGRYCMVGYQSPLLLPLNQKTPEGKSYVDTHGDPPAWAKEIITKSGNYIKRVAFWFGTCIPSTCTEEDLIKMASVVAKPLGIKVSISDCQQDEPFKWPSYAVAAASCLGCLLGMCTIGTLCDAVCRWRNSSPANSDDDHVLLRLLKAFSILTNTERLFSGSGGGGNLACFNGIRFLSATWILLGHTYFYLDKWKYLKYRNLMGFAHMFNGYLPVAVIENFTIPVGSFFFMSGFLLVYTTWNALEKTQGKLNLPMFVVHKFWRMTPALGLTMALLFFMVTIDSGPLWHSTLKKPIEDCRTFAWTNFLYINNFWDSEDLCLLHTWYLGALMQFHIAGVLLLMLTYRWPVVGVVMGLLIAAACALVTVLIVVWHDYPMPAPGYVIKDIDLIEEINSKIYIKPFTHFTTYMIGMVVAYLLLKYHNRKIALKYQVIGWTFAVLSAASSVYGLYGPAESVAVRAMYVAGHRIGWALGIGWMIYACATGNGGIVNRILSWNAMHSLGQLSYLVYLLHPLVIIYRNASLRERVYYGHTEMVFSFLSALVVSMFLAYAGYVTVEMPFASLEKIFFKRKSKINIKEIEPKDKEDRRASTLGPAPFSP